MAVDRYGSEIQHSLYGRRFGLDDKDFVSGPAGQREPQETLTPGSTMDPFATSVLTGTTGTFTIAAPLKKGINKEIIWASTISTAAAAIVRSTALGACSFLGLSSAYGSTAAGGNEDVKRLNLLQVGANVTLRSISTGQWAIIAKPTTALFTISTTS